MFSLSSSPINKPLAPLSKDTTSFPRRTSVTCCARATQRPAATMYEVLAVEETAGPEEIRTAYRRQARRWHPDACPSRAESDQWLFAQRFMAARQAYELLSDPASRECYDLALHSGDQAAAVMASAARARARERGAFGDWEVQLEGLRRRAASRGAESTWGSRMRKAHSSGQSE